MIPIFEPYLVGSEKKYLLDCIKTNWISSQGPYIPRLESEISNFFKVKYCVLTSSCTTALHLSLKALDIGVGDEVICPALTFIAPANMIQLSGAKLVLVDVDPITLTIDPNKIVKQITKKTKAIIVVHQFGHSAHMREITKIAKKYKLKIIEDNAESLGGKYKGKYLGTLGDVATLSFFGNKIITSGEGGAILTNNKKIAQRAQEMRDHGMARNKKYFHKFLGFNYRMTNIQAAIGLSQFENLHKILNIRQKQQDYYYKLLSDNQRINLRHFKQWTKPVHWLLTLRIDGLSNRNLLIKYLSDQKIECRPMINPVNEALHFKSMFKKQYFSVASNISKNYVHLPSSTNLKKNEIKYICDKINSFTKKLPYSSSTINDHI